MNMIAELTHGPVFVGALASHFAGLDGACCHKEIEELMTKVEFQGLECGCCVGITRLGGCNDNGHLSNCIGGEAFDGGSQNFDWFLALTDNHGMDKSRARSGKVDSMLSSLIVKQQSRLR